MRDLLGVVAALVALGACGGKSAVGETVGKTVVPVNHRPNDSECLQPAPPGSCTPGTGFDCPSECDAGTNGRCAPAPACWAGGCYCTYDTCADDTACPAGQTCACHGSPYTFGQGNPCVQGNCRVDGDCGKDGYCSPAYDVPWANYVIGLGYYCHTLVDTCVNDSDCLGQGGCTYSATTGYWDV